MENGLQNIAVMLKESGLPPDDRDEFLDVLRRADTEYLQSLVTLFRSDPGWVKRIYNNYRAKKAALDTHDAAAWKRIIKKEEEILREMTE